MKIFSGKLHLCLSVVLLCVLVSGCSKNPSSNDGKQAVQDKINQDAQGRISLTSFRKTNGQSAEMNGVKLYALDFEAQITFKDNCKWLTDVLHRKHGFQTSKLPSQNLNGLAQFAEDTQNPGTIMKQGQQVTISGTIHFEKKENGWFVDGVEISTTTTRNSSTSHALESTSKTTTEQNNEQGKVFYTSHVPTDIEVKRWFNEKVTSQSHGLARLLKFEEVPTAYNHFDKDMNFIDDGTEMHNSASHPWTNSTEGIHFTCEVAFAKPCKWIEKNGKHGLCFNLAFPGDADYDYPVDNEKIFAISTPYERYHMDFALLFGRQGKGWQMQGIRYLGIKNGIVKADEYDRIECVNNMKQIGLAFRIWSGDHNDMYPQQVSSNSGGTEELWQKNPEQFRLNSLESFQVLSNELVSTTILVCPSDSSTIAATSFQNLQISNVSYVTFKDANPNNPQKIIAVCPIHKIELLGDGSVQQIK